MGEIGKEKSLWLLSVFCFAAMTAAVPFSKMELPLRAGTFLQYYKTALSSRGILFLIPIISVLPEGASYVKETSNGFLKLYIIRISRMDYIKRKILLVYAGGFLPFFVAGVLSFLFHFLLFYPLELKGVIEKEGVLEVLFLLSRICLVGGIMAEISGVFAAVFRNYYMAYGLPFVCYYLLIILKDRYLPDLYAMYPGEWIVPQQDWGTNGMGIWMFFFVFSVGVCLLHGLLLYHRLKEI